MNTNPPQSGRYSKIPLFTSPLTQYDPGSVPSFTTTSSPELNTFLTEIRSTIFLPTALTPSQRRLVYQKKNIPLLTSDVPATVKIGSEIHTLRPLSRQNDEHSTQDSFHGALRLMREAGDWQNVFPLLEGLRKGKRGIEVNNKAKAVRLLCEAGEQRRVLGLVRGAEKTGVRMGTWKVLKEVLGGVVTRLTMPLSAAEMSPSATEEGADAKAESESAGTTAGEQEEGGKEGENSSVEDEYTLRVKRAVAYAESVADLLWQPIHQPPREQPSSSTSSSGGNTTTTTATIGTNDPPSASTSSDSVISSKPPTSPAPTQTSTPPRPADPRTRPEVLGHLLLAHSLLGPRNASAIDGYARLLIENWKPLGATTPTAAPQPTATATAPITSNPDPNNSGTAESPPPAPTPTKKDDRIKPHAANQGLITWAAVGRGMEIAAEVLTQEGGSEGRKLGVRLEELAKEVEGCVDQWVGVLNEGKGRKGKGGKGEEGEGEGEGGVRLKGLVVLDGLRELKPLA